jgi:hypothetical protein
MMFPEFGYIVNTTQMQYFKFKHFMGINMIKDALNYGWQIQDKYIYVEFTIDMDHYKKTGYKNITDLKRPHSA